MSEEAELATALRKQADIVDSEWGDVSADGVLFRHAASLIEAQAARIAVLEEALRGVLKWAEPIAGDNRDEKAAAFEAATTEAARAALGDKT